MKCVSPLLVLCLGVAALNGLPAFAQEDETLHVIEPGQVHVLSDHSARESLGQVHASFGERDLGAARTAATTTSLPLWNYSVTAAQDNRYYAGQFVGASVVNSNTTTTVPVVLVPVILNVTQNGKTYVFDPTAPDPGCLGSSNTGLSLLQQSPIFTNASFTLNGVNVGNTQYGDATLRGEFWYIVTNVTPNYHLLLSPSVRSPLTITVNAGTSGNSTAEVYSLGGSQCGYNTGANPPAKLGLVNINTIDSYLQSYIKANGLTASQFPFFVLYNSAIANGSANNLSDCCILGYHSSLGNRGQTYGIAEFEGRNQTAFSGVSDVATASHEIAEWINDPSGSNPTPAWGNIGQVSGCQSNLEVGDPLSGTLIPPVPMPNGFTYHLQELAYFSWFYGIPTLGAGGKYSSNGSFAGYSKLCPGGGTN